MAKLNLLFPLLISVLAGVPRADTLIVDTDLGYTVYLPARWTVEAVSDSQHRFYETGVPRKSFLSIVRYTRNSSVYPSPDDWSRAHFIAYKVTVEYMADPWGAVLYHDSSDGSRQGNAWAPELYAMFFSRDAALGSWSEYIRYTSVGGYGYELYAIGDTADMALKLPIYGAILQGIELQGSGATESSVRRLSRLSVVLDRGRPPGGRGSTLQGRTLPLGLFPYSAAAQPLCVPGADGMQLRLPSRE